MKQHLFNHKTPLKTL